jgi:hydroxymethylpyrimidine pyrophosphatase-like HAD family hydrolase
MTDKEYKLIVAVDFDETIATRDEKLNPIDLLPNAKEVINWMYDNGIYVIIWTCRSSFELLKATEFLKKNDIKYHTINSNAEHLDFDTSGKIFADIYIDDKGIYTDKIDWLEIKKIIENKICKKSESEVIIQEIILTSRKKK